VNTSQFLVFMKATHMAEKIKLIPAWRGKLVH
jgi:hypothetical protein